MLRTRVKLIPCIVSENSDLKLLVNRYYQPLSITEHLVKLQKHSEFKIASLMRICLNSFGRCAKRADFLLQ